VLNRGVFVLCFCVCFVCVIYVCVLCIVCGFSVVKFSCCV